MDTTRVAGKNDDVPSYKIIKIINNFNNKLTSD